MSTDMSNPDGQLEFDGVGVHSYEKFVKLSIKLLRDARISDGAFRLYLDLMSYAWGEKTTCFPSQKLLCSDLGISRPVVHRRLVELRNAGLLTWKIRGLCASNVYTLHPTRCDENVTQDVSKTTHPDVSDLIHPDVSKTIPELDEVETYEDNLALNTSCLTRNTRARAFIYAATEEPAKAAEAPPAVIEKVATSKLSSPMRPPKREPLFKADGSLPSFGKPVMSAVSSDGTRTMLAGLSLGDGARLAKLYKKWASASEETRTWPTIEIDYLLAWEKRYPKVTGIRWPSYRATSGPDTPGRAGFKAGAAFYGIMADLHRDYGYERLRDYFVFCVEQWNRLLAHVSTTEDVPNPMLIAKHAKTWMLWFDAKFVPSIRPTDFRGPLDDITQKPSEESSHAPSSPATPDDKAAEIAEIRRKFAEQRAAADQRERERAERLRLARRTPAEQRAALDAEFERRRAERLKGSGSNH